MKQLPSLKQGVGSYLGKTYLFFRDNQPPLQGLAHAEITRRMTCGAQTKRLESNSKQSDPPWAVLLLKQKALFFNGGRPW
jgi:hypothetical protein